SRHQTPRRLAADQPVHAGGYLRAHLHPKRFPAAYHDNYSGMDNSSRDSSNVGSSHMNSNDKGGAREDAASGGVGEGGGWEAGGGGGGRSGRSSWWLGRLLAVREDHVVVSKPPGVQVPPTVDNVRESLLACVEGALSLPPGSLLPAHRLDAGTEGVVVLARTPAFAAHFRQIMGEKAKHAVRKRYRCLVPRPPPATLLAGPQQEEDPLQPQQHQQLQAQPPPQQQPQPQQEGAHNTGCESSSSGNNDPCNDRNNSDTSGSSSSSSTPAGASCEPGELLWRGESAPLVHWVLEDQRAAGEMAHTVVVGAEQAGALRCELRLEQVERVRLSPPAAALWGAREAYEVTVDLVTGRTHQVRVQLAAEGLPLLGDHL
ncbi:hypothetical protein Agub_g14809, partial [Astrephomene gubernaculifera]